MHQPLAAWECPEGSSLGPHTALFQVRDMPSHPRSPCQEAVRKGGEEWDILVAGQTGHSPDLVAVESPWGLPSKGCPKDNESYLWFCHCPAQGPWLSYPSQGPIRKMKKMTASKVTFSLMRNSDSNCIKLSTSAGQRPAEVGGYKKRTHSLSVLMKSEFIAHCIVQHFYKVFFLFLFLLLQVKNGKERKMLKKNVCVKLTLKVIIIFILNFLFNFETHAKVESTV